MMRTSKGIARVAPMGRTSRVSITRSSFTCSGQRHVADLVEEERALVGGDEEAALVGDGAGERALGVAEELALEQRLGDRAAVDRDEGLVRARARAVDRAREQLLAGAALALDQDARVARGHALRLGEQVLHQRGARDDVLAPHLARAGLRGRSRRAA